jgi:hypothetical protein
MSYLNKEPRLHYEQHLTLLSRDTKFTPPHVKRYRMTEALPATLANDHVMNEEGFYKATYTIGNDTVETPYIPLRQYYADSEGGVHFPLRAGTEVILAFLEGDPERPFIAGLATVHPQQADRHTFASHGGHALSFELNNTHLSTAKKSSSLMMQTTSQNNEVTLHTKGTLHLNGKQLDETTSTYATTSNHSLIDIKGAITHLVKDGDMATTVGHDQRTLVKKDAVVEATEHTMTVGSKTSLTIHTKGGQEYVGKEGLRLTAKEKITFDTQQHFTAIANKQVNFMTSNAALMFFENGDIKVNAQSI